MNKILFLSVLLISQSAFCNTSVFDEKMHNLHLEYKKKHTLLRLEQETELNKIKDDYINQQREIKGRLRVLETLRSRPTEDLWNRTAEQVADEEKTIRELPILVKHDLEKSQLAYQERLRALWKHNIKAIDDLGEDYKQKITQLMMERQKKGIQ